MKIIFDRIFIAFVFCVGTMGCIEKPLIATSEPDPLAVYGLKAQYPGSGKIVYLSWDAKNPEEIDFYRIYRTTKIKIIGTDTLVDTAFLESSGNRLNINKNVTSYEDVLGLENIAYYYVIRAAKISASPIDDSKKDTLFGSINYEANGSVAKIQLENAISFSINNGDINTSNDSCLLYVNDANVFDSQKKAATIRITQVYQQYFKKQNNDQLIPINVPIDDANNPPDTASIGNWIRLGALTADGKYASGVELVAKANFDFASAQDTLNNVSVYGNAELNQIRNLNNEVMILPWKLKKGNETSVISPTTVGKYVWIEITYENSNLKKDTIYDNIHIAPWRAKLFLRNEQSGINQSMLKVVLGNNGFYNIYKPFLKFNVSIFADSTFAERFSTWIITGENNTSIGTVGLPPSIPQLETMPAELALSAPAGAHSDEKIYQYDIDTLNGWNNIKILRRTFQRPSLTFDNLAFRLTGIEPLNEFAVSGSIWGAHPRVWKTTGYDDNTQHIYQNKSKSEIWNLLTKIYKPNNTGKKEIVLVGLFKGIYFEDTRLVFSTSNDNDYLLPNINNPKVPSADQRAFLDVYPPQIEYPAANRPITSGTFSNSSEIVGQSFNFDLSLDEAAFAVDDKGYAPITAVKLIIAYNDGSIPWNLQLKTNSLPRIVTADTLSLERIYQLRYKEYPLPITTVQYKLKNIRWENIDASTWPSGKYIFTVVTRDKFGNEGIAPINADYAVGTYPYTNPMQIKITTGN